MASRAMSKEEELKKLEQKLNSVKQACEECINEVQSELDAFKKGGLSSKEPRAKKPKLQQSMDVLTERVFECTGAPSRMQIQQTLTNIDDKLKILLEKNQGEQEELKKLSKITKDDIQGIYTYLKNYKQEVMKLSEYMLQDSMPKKIGYLQAGSHDIKDFNVKSNFGGRFQSSSGEFTAPYHEKVRDVYLEGFCAETSWRFPAGSYVITNFFVKANNGNHFNPLLGEFKAPRNALYLINITTNYESPEISISLQKKIWQQVSPNSYIMSPCNVPGNQRTTQFVQMNINDVIYLTLTTSVQTQFICFQFSCRLLL